MILFFEYTIFFFNSSYMIWTFFFLAFVSVIVMLQTYVKRKGGLYIAISNTKKKCYWNSCVTSRTFLRWVLATPITKAEMRGTKAVFLFITFSFQQYLCYICWIHCYHMIYTQLCLLF